MSWKNCSHYRSHYCVIRDSQEIEKPTENGRRMGQWVLNLLRLICEGPAKKEFVSGIIKLVVGRMWNILSISAGDLRNYTYLIHEFCMQLMDTKLVT